MLYAREGAVRHITVDSDQVHAKVQGSTSYTVALRLDTDELTIRCNCPAAVYQPLCKHGVALALVYLEHYKNGTAVPKSGKTQTEQLSEWLLTWDKSDLVDMLMQYIVDNDEEEERWLLRYKMAHQALTATDLKDYIQQSLPLEEAYDYEEVNAYFEHAIGLLKMIVEKLDALDPTITFPLLQYAYERLNEAVQYVHDHDGCMSLLDDMLAPRLIVAFTQIPWGDDKKVRFILQQQEKSWDIYLNLPEALLVTSDIQLAYVKECRRLWDGLPPLMPDASWETKHRYWRLSRQLLREAKENDDLELQISLSAKMATEWNDYLGLCRLTMRNDDLPQAKLWLAKAQASVSHDNDRLQVLECDIALALQCKEWDRAWQQQWVHFQLGKRFEHYQQLVSLAKTLGYDESLYQHQVEAMLHEEVKKAQKRPPSRYRAENVHDTLLAFYRYHQEWRKALAFVQYQTCSVSERRQLANDVLGEHPDAALALYRQVLGETVDQTNNGAYQQAVNWMLALQDTLKQTQPEHAPAMINELVQYLQQEKKAKRNLMALLNTHFPLLLP
ncbi:hypothetical protein PBPRA2668 [Photobacterium profundum SS9]|uniref:SWIM-type domain-containing protein n=1 Tax=Photobacterium profundum (strain SS9) TaxID=298386 RepID=Q6LNT0_PHOPR|nr:hypothetical protein PBPRA2668 [Photobacterium profundum SS9]